MNMRLTTAIAVFLFTGVPICAHRLDEYLQATILSIEKDRVQALMRLVPGVAVSSAVLASIDTNADGVLSETEKQTYAERVLHDLSLTINDHHLKPRLTLVNFPGTEEMKEGLGEIQIEFHADLPHSGADRRLVFENHHQSRVAAYLVNCLVPRDRNIQIVAQNRNENQSFYQLDYALAGNRSNVLTHTLWSSVGGSLGATAALLLFARIILLRWQHNQN